MCAMIASTRSRAFIRISVSLVDRPSSASSCDCVTAPQMSGRRTLACGVIASDRALRSPGRGLRSTNPWACKRSTTSMTRVLGGLRRERASCRRAGGRISLLTRRAGRCRLACLVYSSETIHLLQASRAFTPAAVTCDRRRFPKLRRTMRSIPHHALSLHPAGGKVFPPAGFSSTSGSPREC